MLSNTMKLRAFPYPFNAGLAICSDIDECDYETFIKIHRYINLDLGLPVSDSFFGIANSINKLAYFNPDGSDRPHEAEFIRQAICDGLIDSLHSWGDFSALPPEPSFLQNIAKKLTDDIVKYNLSIPIWINHGSPNNYQNLFARVHPEYQGDNPFSSMYTMNFIKAIGVKYCWLSELLKWPLSSNDQKIKLKIFIFNFLKNIIKILSGKSVRIKSYRQVTQLINTIELRDRSKLLSFGRFSSYPEGKIWVANRNTLRYSLSREVLVNLLYEEGCMIIYTHLAKPISQQDVIFDEEDQKALENLYSLYQKKKILVASTSKLLQFKMIHDNLKWNSAETSEGLVVDITGVDDPIGGMRVPSIKELEGICFYSPVPDKTRIMLSSVDIPSVIFSSDSKNGGWVGFNMSEAPKTGILK